MSNGEFSTVGMIQDFMDKGNYDIVDAIIEKCNGDVDKLDKSIKVFWNDLSTVCHEAGETIAEDILIGLLLLKFLDYEGSKRYLRQFVPPVTGNQKITIDDYNKMEGIK